MFRGHKKIVVWPKSVELSLHSTRLDVVSKPPTLMITSLAAVVLLTQTLPTLQPNYSFVRSVDRSDGISISQTAARKLVAPGKPDVWLVGAAHIGQKDYYSQIQNLLNAQDTVLFEGVSPKGTDGKPAKVDPKGQPMVYQVVAKFIGLDYQLADIDYSKPNWINSDLTIDELEVINRKASGGKPSGFDTIKQVLKPGSEQSKMLTEFFKNGTPGMREAFRIFLIEKLSKVDTLLPAVTDKATLNLLLTARNESIIRCFDRQLKKSDTPKSVAIFYGAAHQIDVKNRLVKAYGYHEVEQRWFTFATADRKKLDDSGKQFLNMMNSMPFGL